jgi:hypothetical protein
MKFSSDVVDDVELQILADGNTQRVMRLKVPASGVPFQDTCIEFGG